MTIKNNVSIRLNNGIFKIFNEVLIVFICVIHQYTLEIIDNNQQFKTTNAYLYIIIILYIY